MKKWYQEESFLDLRDEWYRKAAETGFEDIEILDKITREHGPLMHGVSTGDLRRALYKPETEEYFRSAAKYLIRVENRWYHRAKAGKCTKEEVRQAVRIWREHAKGQSEAKIAKTLGYKLSLVRRIVREEKAMMKAYWDRLAEKDFEEQETLGFGEAL